MTEVWSCEDITMTVATNIFNNQQAAKKVIWPPKGVWLSPHFSHCTVISTPYTLPILWPHWENQRVYCCIRLRGCFFFLPPDQDPGNSAQKRVTGQRDDAVRSQGSGLVPSVPWPIGPTAFPQILPHQAPYLSISWWAHHCFKHKWCGFRDPLEEIWV